MLKKEIGKKAVEGHISQVMSKVDREQLETWAGQDVFDTSLIKKQIMAIKKTVTLNK